MSHLFKNFFWHFGLNSLPIPALFNVFAFKHNQIDLIQYCMAIICLFVFYFNITILFYSLLRTYKVENLRPGQNYLIQVTVKQQDGLSLSYDYLYVKTKNIC